MYCHCILDLAIITNFTVVPGFFTGLETSCTDSDPYDNFTLTCTASKPALVLPELEVIWYHNGTVRNAVQNNNTYITNTINFPKSFANDSGIYICVAKLVIPDSSNITQQVNISIRRKIVLDNILYNNNIIIAQRTPYPATDINVIAGQTIATISFTIPAIAYTPETYNINYTGLEFQFKLTSSSQIMSTGNITDVKVRYQITLSNLEEANTYSFSVVSTNCIGSTNTILMNFTTLPSCKYVRIMFIFLLIYSTCCSTS